MAQTRRLGWCRPGLRRACAAAGSGWLSLLVGCGLAGNPQPPTLWLPEPVKDLTAMRVGDEVRLRWTMPKNTTDKVGLKRDQRAHFCWVAEAAGGAGKPSGKISAANTPGAAIGKEAPAPQPPVFDAKSCRAAGDGMFAPEKPADATVKLPAELTSGAGRAVAFYVELQNHAGKTAGPSNAAFVAAGAAPASVTGLRLETRAEGVVVRWDASGPGAQMTMRMHRELVSAPGATKGGEAKAGAPNSGAPKRDESAGAGPAEQQVLEVELDKADPGGAVDRDAQLDHEWKYWAERVVKVEAGGRVLEIAGRPSEPVTINAKDVFPPEVPAGLAAVADAQAKAMDLSWTPDTDADLAGYVVYRRDVTAGGPPTGQWERISGSAPLVPPSFSDGNVVPGHRYTYAVSAVDQDGNESGKSGQVEEEMPQ